MTSAWLFNVPLWNEVEESAWKRALRGLAMIGLSSAPAVQAAECLAVLGAFTGLQDGELYRMPQGVVLQHSVAAKVEGRLHA
eukprot:s3773_g5.t1